MSYTTISGEQKGIALFHHQHVAKDNIINKHNAGIKMAITCDNFIHMDVIEQVIWYMEKVWCGSDGKSRA